MANEVDVSKLIAAYQNPSPTNPYLFNGTSYAQRIIERAFRTPQDVVRYISDAKVIHHVSNEDIAAATKLSQESVSHLVNQGEGCMVDFLAVLDYLGVWPVCIPNAIALGG